MGWSTFTSILNAFSVELKFDDVKLVGNLLSIEGMTHKMARILVDNGISTIALVAQQSSATLTQYFMLSLGFHLQVRRLFSNFPCLVTLNNNEL